MSIHSLANRQIILGLTGGIAAYKSADLARRLRDAGASVRVVMTPAATEFITPLTMQAVSGNPVHTDLLDAAAEAAMGHIELARWGDLVLVAPATADFMARLCHGQADDLLSALCLASDAPRVLAPAMNQAMWRDAATQDNQRILHDRGISILGPASGAQACGDSGPGRMVEADEIVSALAALFAARPLDGKRVLITAGPTREALDPVRYLSNHSSGKMGFALATAAAEAGAITTLIAGPVALADPPQVERINVESARQMHAETLARSQNVDIFIAAAAVADFRPADIAEQKIKKGRDQEMQLQLVRNPDILADVASSQKRPFCVGFAAETENLVKHARDKLQRKNVDMIVANDVAQAGIGFNSDYNAVTVISGNDCQALSTSSKHRLADRLMAMIATHITDNGGNDDRGTGR